MRATAVVIAAVTVAGVASLAKAERMILRPTITDACPSAKTWDKVAACLARHGTVRVLEHRGAAKLVQIALDEKTGIGLPGVYLYTQRGGNWQIGGAVEGHDLRLASYEQIGRGAGRSHRFDLTSSAPTYVDLGGRNEKGLLKVRRAVFCAGTRPLCNTVIVSCDLYVDGKSYWTFRGTVTVTADTLQVAGDRSKAGSYCSQVESTFLPTAGSDIQLPE